MSLSPSTSKINMVQPSHNNAAWEQAAHHPPLGAELGKLG